MRGVASTIKTSVTGAVSTKACCPIVDAARRSSGVRSSSVFLDAFQRHAPSARRTQTETVRRSRQEGTVRFPSGRVMPAVHQRSVERSASEMGSVVKERMVLRAFSASVSVIFNSRGAGSSIVFVVIKPSKVRRCLSTSNDCSSAVWRCLYSCFVREQKKRRTSLKRSAAHRSHAAFG